MAKWDLAKQLKVSLGDEEVEILSWADYSATGWTKYEAELNADSDTTLVIKFFGVQGDLLVDHVYMTSTEQRSSCSRSIDLSFTRKYFLCWPYHLNIIYAHILSLFLFLFNLCHISIIFYTLGRFLVLKKTWRYSSKTKIYSINNGQKFNFKFF